MVKVTTVRNGSLFLSPRHNLFWILFEGIKKKSMKRYHNGNLLGSAIAVDPHPMWNANVIPKLRTPFSFLYVPLH